MDENTTSLPPSSRTRTTLRRSTTDRMLGGVCGGLATTLGVDATILRIGLVVAAVLGFGAGIIIYLVAWMLMPPDTEPV